MLHRWTSIALVLTIPALAAGQDKALPPEQAAAAWQLPPGFRSTLFAGEPDIVQPIAFTFDDRGRVWVVECLSYPTWKEDGTGHDRVTILEDTDNDGRHDKRTVFYDKGVNLSGIEVGFGGVWLTAVPKLIFIPDANADDKPDGEPLVALDGWDLKAKHNVVGNMAWGPDGWLYGCNGILSNSKIGRPGTPDEKRVSMNCGVWRFHPVKKTFEAYAHGTTNPWGIDWDARGQMFITNCVIKHIFHVMPGAHFQRMFGQDINPHSYGLIESCADHFHWAGGHWTASRRAPAENYNTHSDAGGGHAHSGCMIYLGTNWPAEYRGDAFMVNIHGQRLNRDKLEREGSTYVAGHGEDAFFCKDPWFRGVAVRYGIDGGVYVADWSDTGECHDYTEEDCDKTGGRIFKIVYTGPRKLEDNVGVNEFRERHEQRRLQEKAAAGQLGSLEHTRLRKLLLDPEERPAHPGIHAQRRLRALWTLHVIGRLDEKLLLEVMKSPEEDLRAWAVTLACESPPSASARKRLAELAATDPSPFVRLHVASALQRIPLADRWPIATALVTHGEDADDPYLPLMCWYAVEPLVPHNVRQAIEKLPDAKVPLVRQYLTRRVVTVYDDAGGEGSSAAWVLDELLMQAAQNPSWPVQADILSGIGEAFRGRRGLKPPPAWNDAYTKLSASTDRRVKQRADELAVLFGDEEAVKKLLYVMSIELGDLERRRQTLALLDSRRDPAIGARLLAMLVKDEPSALRPEIIRALAGYEQPDIPARLVELYARLTPAEQQDAIQTLTARPAFALALLDAIDRKQIPRQDVSALIIRQLLALEQTPVTDRLREVWGEVRPAAAGKKERIEAFKNQLTADVLQQADLSQGRAIFAKNCASCHKLFDEGTKLGPELTGAQRHSLDYVLDNVLDPNAIVPREYRASVLRLADGRIVQGVIVEETPQTLVVQTPNETLRLPAGEVEARKESGLSMMPEGLFDRLTADEIRDLVAYLAAKEQVPLPVGAGE
jgi:putative membrane-bound dehydrogenase-like protein